MKKLFALAALLLAFAAPATAPAQTLHRVAFEQPQARVALPRILAQIAQRTPGRHLNTTEGQSGGRPVYFVQWQMSDGRVVVFVVDAENGQIIGRQGG